MHVLPWGSLLLSLVACARLRPGEPSPQAGAGCPAGSGVLVATYIRRDPGAGRSGWVAPLHARAAPPGDAPPDHAAIDATAVAAAGAPPLPGGTLWLVTASGPPCRITPGRFYAARLPGPPVGVAYGVELEGCAAPASAEEGDGLVLASEVAPSGCRIETPRPIAARLGEAAAGGSWQRPTRATPLPPALAAAIPPKDCAAPACETLWAFAELEVGDRPVAWAGAVNWLTVGDASTPCSWPLARFSGLFVPGPAGPVRVTEGLEHPLVLSGALVDDRGGRVLLLEGPGEFATYDVGPEGARPGRRTTWALVPDSAWDAVDRLGPACAPSPQATDAPPAGAQPVSPY